MMVLANLAQQAKTPLNITLFEQHPELGLGVAYGTNDTVHLLNVRADKMGAIANKPDHFWLWLQSEIGQAEIKRIWPGHYPEAHDFVPRRVYRAYIQDILKNTLTVAPQKHVHITLKQARVRDIEQEDGVLVVVTENERIATDRLVIASGNEPPKHFGFEAKLGSNYVGDIWQPPQGSYFPERVDELPADSNVVIIGTGLTGIDAILTLKRNNFKGTIYAISRGGLRPAVHTSIEPYAAWEWVKNPVSAPKTALGMLRALKKEVKKVSDWRAVVDSIRPVTQDLWKHLPLAEKKKILRRLFTFWNIHRHRMAPEISQKIDGLIATGKLKIISAKIVDVSENMLVRYKKRGEAAQTLQAALVINCTGPDWRLVGSHNPLIRQLLARGFIAQHKLGLGLEVNENLAAKGIAEGKIFPIGPLMIGELLESVAVPELREQAFTTAVNVLKSLAKEPQ